ncbi:MAG: hypothetical protein KJ964_00860 [Verrucomicrobia bacterium]|nr:hypothetical protein [Verrucomicrobiota bacterium]MBU1734288.1 hypothetical protein [Verrucomicrobiota bacterium]MBU1857009.1 hypothetical protein [Verrucomicrobiota bacterium]
MTAITQSYAGDFNGGFEAGLTEWRPYEAQAPKSILNLCQESAFSGKCALKVDTPGIARIEGVTVSVPATTNHNHTIKAWLKGSGTVMLGVSQRGGWIYGRACDVTGAWKEYTIRFLANMPAPVFAVLTTGDKPQKTTFYIDNVAVVCEENEALPDAEVPPFRVEAEDFRAAGTPGKVITDKSAGGGAYAEQTRYYWLAYAVPFVPQTARPFYIWLRVRGSVKAESIYSITRNLPGQQTEVFGRVTIPASDSWRWVRTGPYTARMGKTFSVTTSSPVTDAVIALDSMVIATDGNLDEQYLNGLCK